MELAGNPPPYPSGDTLPMKNPCTVSRGFELDGVTIRTAVVGGVKVASLVDYAMLVRSLDRNKAAKYVTRLRKRYPNMGYLLHQFQIRVGLRRFTRRGI